MDFTLERETTPSRFYSFVEENNNKEEEEQHIPSISSRR